MFNREVDSYCSDGLENALASSNILSSLNCIRSKRLNFRLTFTSKSQQCVSKITLLTLFGIINTHMPAMTMKQVVVMSHTNYYHLLLIQRHRVSISKIQYSLRKVPVLSPRCHHIRQLMLRSLMSAVTFVVRRFFFSRSSFVF